MTKTKPNCSYSLS